MSLRKVFSFATLTLLVALCLSSIAAFYSVKGLTAIFAAAVVPIIIMGGALEIAKVVTTVWLHRYWKRSGIILKLYLIPAVIALAFLTSMGIFGYLSKAHSDQTLVSGDVAAKVELIDEKIKISRDNIAMNQKALEQMNSQVDQLLGRTTDDTGANRAVQVRRQQASERNRLNNEIAIEQANIARLNEEAAPIRAEIRKVEAEVGPIKYIAAMIYGDNPDTNLLEKAVRWVIILIVFVFDPLALVLVLAAQSSYRWLDEDLKKKEEDDFADSFSDNRGKVDDQVDIEYDRASNETVQRENKNENIIQPYVIESYEDYRSDVHEASDTVTDEILYELDETKEQDIQPDEVTPDLTTEGVTLETSESGEYVVYGGKSVSKKALMEINPALFAGTDNFKESETNFGTEFPKLAKKGDMFVRVDILPNRVFKFDGQKWIEVNKDSSTSYLYDEEYIKYLIKKLETGEYDVDLLSDNERSQIEDYLSNGKSINDFE